MGMFKRTRETTLILQRSDISRGMGRVSQHNTMATFSVNMDEDMEDGQIHNTVLTSVVVHVYSGVFFVFFIILHLFHSPES